MISFAKKLLVLFFSGLFVCSVPPRALATTTAAPGTTVSVEHGPSQSAVQIAMPLGLPVTNSMIGSWIVAAGLIIFAQVATRRMNVVPIGIQNF